MCNKNPLKFQGFKNCLEAAETECKINNSEGNSDVDSLKKDFKKLIKYNKLILKIQQRNRSEKHNVFIEDIIKMPLSSNWFNKNIWIWKVKI